MDELATASATVSAVKALTARVTLLAAGLEWGDVGSSSCRGGRDDAWSRLPTGYLPVLGLHAGLGTWHRSGVLCVGLGPGDRSRCQSQHFFIESDGAGDGARGQTDGGAEWITALAFHLKDFKPVFRVHFIRTDGNAFLGALFIEEGDPRAAGNGRNAGEDVVFKRVAEFHRTGWRGFGSEGRVLNEIDVFRIRSLFWKVRRSPHAER